LKVKIGIGLGFPFGSSHGITAVFPSDRFNIFVSLIDILNGSKAKNKKKDNDVIWILID